MPKADLENLSLHYVQMGRGPDVMLIHGLASDLAFWYLGVMRLLSRHFRVTAFDMRGHGYSDTPPTGYNSADLAGDLCQLLDFLEIERAHLVGHSFGGSVALHFAAIHPKRVLSLTLADARVNALQERLPPRGDERWRKVREAVERLGVQLPGEIPAVAYAVLEELLGSFSEAPSENLIRAGLTGFFGIRNGSSRKLTRWVRLMENTTAKTDFNAVADLTRERLQALDHSALAIYGENSCCMETCEGLLQELQCCSSIILPQTGHLHPFLQPKIFVEHVEPWIAHHDEPPGS